MPTLLGAGGALVSRRVPHRVRHYTSQYLGVLLLTGCTVARDTKL